MPDYFSSSLLFFFALKSMCAAVVCGGDASDAQWSQLDSKKCEGMRMWRKGTNFNFDRLQGLENRNSIICDSAAVDEKQLHNLCARQNKTENEKISRRCLLRYACGGY